MTDQPEQLMNAGQEISMTATEKAAMRHQLRAYALSYHTPAAGVAWSWVRRHAWMSASLAALIVVGGTGVSASMAGPNDALYGFRLSVNDRIESALAPNEEAQLEVELRQLGRQLSAEEGFADEALADDEQGIVNDEKPPQETKQQLNRKDDERDADKDDISEKAVRGPDAAQKDDEESEKEHRKIDRELQQEESATIEQEL